MPGLLRQRFIDDIFFTWIDSAKNVNKLLEDLFEVHPDLQFT